MAASSCVHEPLQETDRTGSSAVPRMEPLWSPVVANGGNRRQIDESRKPQKQAKSVATSCHRLPEKFPGKQGVCRGLPPVAGGPLPEREEVDLLENAKSCEPEGPQDLTT